MSDETIAPTDDAAQRDCQLDALIAAYVQARDDGRPLDRQALLAQHPGLHAELERYFEDADRLEWLVTSTVPAVPTAGAWFGPYRVLRMIRRGGMGVVYEAEDPATA